MPASSQVGVTQSGKISWFGGPHDSMSGPTTSSGLPVSYPGISTYNQATKNGYWLVHMPNGHSAVLKQTDIGPAPWTNRNFDFTYTALPLLGYSEGNFPTDANITAVYLGKSVPKQYANLVIGAGGHAVAGKNIANPTAAGSPGGTASAPVTKVSTSLSGGQIDYGSAILDAMLAHGEKPINPSGKFTAGGGLLSKAIANVATGAYTTPNVANTTLTTTNPAVKAVAKARAMPSSPGAGDVNPLPGWSLGQTDMGIDANANVGRPILAFNDSKVTNIIGGWYSGQPLVAMEVLSGPNKGKFWYVAEQINNIPHIGQVIPRGGVVARYAPSGTGIEIGWAANGSGTTLASAHGNGAYAVRHAPGGTPEGRDFRQKILRA